MNNSSNKIVIRLTDEMLMYLRLMASAEGITISEFIRRLITNDMTTIKYD